MPRRKKSISCPFVLMGYGKDKRVDQLLWRDLLFLPFPRMNPEGKGPGGNIHMHMRGDPGGVSSER